MRIYKHYDFNVDNQYTAAKQMSFSSYPGIVESIQCGKKYVRSRKKMDKRGDHLRLKKN